MSATGLRLLAQDMEGLRVLAAATQDALVAPSKMKRDARGRSFGLELGRFQWEIAGKRGPWSRTRSMLAFQDVSAVQFAGLRQGSEDPMVLLHIAFDPDPAPPGGVVRLVFAGGGEVRLAVECLDATLLDTGPSWPTRRKPEHGGSR